MPDKDGNPTVGDALGAMHKRLAELEETTTADKARLDFTSDTLKVVNAEFGLSGDKAITPDSEGLDHSDPIKFQQSILKVAAARVRAPVEKSPAHDDDDEDDGEEDDDTPVTHRRLERAINRIVGGGHSQSPRPNSGRRSVTIDDVEAASEEAGGIYGMKEPIKRMAELVRAAEKDPATIKFLKEQEQGLVRGRGRGR